MNLDRIEAIRKRVAESSPDGLRSNCGEYNCDCHRDVPDLLSEIDMLRAEIEQWRNDDDLRHERELKSR